MPSPTAPPRRATRNVTRTRLRSDRERSRLAAPPAPTRRSNSPRAIRATSSTTHGSPRTSGIAPMTPERLAPKTRRTPQAGRIRLPATPRSRARIRLALLLRTRPRDRSSQSPPIGTIRTPRIASLSRTDRRRTPSRLTKRIPTTKTRRMRRVRSPTRTRLRPSKRGQKTPRMARRTRRMPAPRPSGRIRRSKRKPLGKPPILIARRPRTRPPARTRTRPRRPTKRRRLTRATPAHRNP